MARIEKDDVMLATDAGKLVILDYYPQSAVGSSRRNFKMRADDKNPSGSVFFKDNTWFIQDKGGSDTKAYSAFALVMDKEGMTFPAALEHMLLGFAPPTLTRRDLFLHLRLSQDMEKMPG